MTDKNCYLLSLTTVYFKLECRVEIQVILQYTEFKSVVISKLFRKWKAYLVNTSNAKFQYLSENQTMKILKRIITDIFLIVEMVL